MLCGVHDLSEGSGFCHRWKVAPESDAKQQRSQRLAADGKTSAPRERRAAARPDAYLCVNCKPCVVTVLGGFGAWRAWHPSASRHPYGWSQAARQEQLIPDSSTPDFGLSDEQKSHENTSRGPCMHIQCMCPHTHSMCGEIASSPHANGTPMIMDQRRLHGSCYCHLPLREPSCHRA